MSIMIKSWKLFEDEITFRTKDDIKNNFLKKYNYSPDDILISDKIRNERINILNEYGLRLDFSRIDKGLPFIDISEADQYSSTFACYHIKERRFSMWASKKYSRRDEWSIVGSKYKNIEGISWDGYYLYIEGDFFEKIENLYYIYYST